MLAATFLATFLIPMFYVLIADKLRRKPSPVAVPAQAELKLGGGE